MDTNICCGFGRMNCTPPLNLSMEGNWGERYPEGVDSQLYVNAMVLDDGKTQTAVLSVDVCWVPQEMFHDIREGIARACQISADNVIVSATHTHTGPRLSANPYDAYTANLRDLAISAAKQAQGCLQPVQISAGKSISGTYVHNRRLRRPDGTITMNWIRGDAVLGCIEEGRSDPEILAIRFDDEQGNPRGFLINYANHNNAFGRPLISSDISGEVSGMLRRQYGEDLAVLFMLGACGNVNWIDFKTSNWSDTGHYQRIASDIAGAILSMQATRQYLSIESIDVISRQFTVQERPYNDYDTCQDMTFGGEAVFPYFFEMKAKATGQPLKNHIADLHLLRIGKDIVIATSPFELFADYALEIKAASVYPYTLVAELTNGSLFYLPTPEAYEQGGYEIRKPATLVPVETGAMVVSQTVEMLKMARLG